MENQLYYGDNLGVIKRHIKDESVDLVCPQCGRFSLFKRFFVAAVSERHGRRGKLSLARFCIKYIHYIGISFRHPNLCHDWFDFLDSAAIRPFVAANPVLPLKPFRPYLSRSLNVWERMRVIRDSLSFLVEQKNFIPNVGHAFVIATVNLGNDPSVSFRLKFNRQKEGEATLYLSLADDKIVMYCHFSFERKSDGPRVMRIGCIQGKKMPEMQKQLEKNMHGLRTRSLLLFACQEVAHALGVKEIFGVSNKNQVYRTFAKKMWVISDPSCRRFSFDYDAFWTEADGVLDAEGWFRLPPRLVKRAKSEMKPNKRSMYMRRYAMLDKLSLQIHHALNETFTFTACQ